MVSSSELIKSSSTVSTVKSLRPYPVHKARKLQQATQNTVTRTTEPENKDVIIIESEDNNPNTFSQPEANRDESLRLLSVDQARKMLGISHITLKRLIQERAIKAVKINTRYKISLSTLQEFTRGAIIAPEGSDKPSSNQTPDSILDDLIHKFSK